MTLLKQFVKVNSGELQIISGNGFYKCGRECKKQYLEGWFPGTIVNIVFRTDDDKSYTLIEQPSNTDLF